MTSSRHNDPQTPHERARSLASARLDEPLAPADDAWLADHLAECGACRSIADGFWADRELLRAMPTPAPPRDLWARTSSALERERVRAGAERAAGGTSGLRIRWGALAGLAAVLVVGILVGRTLMSAGTAGTGAGAASVAPLAGSSPAGSPAATPLAVVPSNVAWVAKGADGKYGLNVANVASVCPPEAAADCAPLNTDTRQVLALDQQPSSVALAPATGQAAVVEGDATSSGGSIFVVPVGSPSPGPSPSAEPTVPASSEPSPIPTASPGPEASPTIEPSVPPSSAEPTPPPTASTGPTPSPTASALSQPSEAPTPTATPAASAAGALAIISDVVVVGAEPSYSADGRWLAFSARPAAGTVGPDIYVWQAGDATAHPLTSDHGSVFSSWVDGEIVGSRAEAEEGASGASDPTAGRPVIPVSFLIDPARGTESATFAGWRPSVDPKNRWVVYWTGDLRFDVAAHAWLPEAGHLEIASWAAAGPNGNGDASRRQLPVGFDQAVAAWDARWDPSGKFVGIWIGDRLAVGLGRLSLLAIDPATGVVDASTRPFLSDAPALAGFAIGNGRIAWATPPGQDGTGSRLQVLAWKGPDAGKITTDPAPPREDILVVH